MPSVEILQYDENIKPKAQLLPEILSNFAKFWSETQILPKVGELREGLAEGSGGGLGVEFLNYKIKFQG